MGPLVTHAGRDILHTEDYDTFLPMGNAQEGRVSVRKLNNWKSTAVKVWYLAPAEERQSMLDEAIMAVGDEAGARGLPLIADSQDWSMLTFIFRKRAGLTADLTAWMPLRFIHTRL